MGWPGLDCFASGLFCFLQTRYAVTSVDARVAGTFSGCGAAKKKCGLGGPGDDAAWVTRRGVGCQMGEVRAFAAAARRLAARPHASAAGQPDAIALLIRRTLTRTRAPILSSLRRMVPQVALANGVWCRAMRRKAHSST